MEAVMRKETIIHPSAIVHSQAQLGQAVDICPFSILEAGARIGDGSRIGSHVRIERGRALGPG